MGIMEIINNKDNLQEILRDVVHAFERAGTDDFEDELDKKNKGMYLKYTVNYNNYKLTISFFNGQEEESVYVPYFDAFPLLKLTLFLNNFYPEIILNYAEFDVESGYMKLYFQAEPKSFNDFKNQINIADVKVIRDDRTQEPHSQHSNEDEADR